MADILSKPGEHNQQYTTVGSSEDGSSGVIPKVAATLSSGSITNITSVDTVDNITSVDTVDNITSVDTVDILSEIAAGENHLGEVGGSSDVIEITPTLDTNIYASGDVLFETIEVASAMRVNGGEGFVQNITVLDKDDQAGDFDLVFLKTNVSIGTANAAVSITDTNAEQILGIIRVYAGNYADLVASQLATKSNVGLSVEAAAGSTSLFLAGISRAAKTYTASGLVIKIGLVRN